MPSVSAVCRELEAVFPDFEKWLLHDAIFCNSEGSFTYCGVFLELVHFLSDRPDQPGEVWRKLGNVVEDMAKISSPAKIPRQDDLSEAVELCFLETLGGYAEISENLRPFLSQESLRMLDLDIG